jgi:hypothetical protein
MFNKVNQTVVGGFQRHCTTRNEICGSDCVFIALLGANGRGRKCAQVGGKIQGRILNVLGFQMSDGWLLVVKRLKRCSLCRDCMAFGRG